MKVFLTPGRIWFFLTLVLLVFQVDGPCFSQERGNQPLVKKNDSLSKNEQREIRRNALKESKTRSNLFATVVFARMQTKVSFESPSGLLSANVGLEKQLGLPGASTFITAGFSYRFTPTSGIYAYYYGINRKEEKHTSEDIIFYHDTIPSGTKLMAYFNTQVVSVGYLLSVMQDPNAFLGLYLNFYVMNINTGVQSDIGHIDEKVYVWAPLPNFGLIADFRLVRWLHLAGNIGFFSLHTDSFGGTIFDLKAALVFKPAKWVGISICYQEFDINLFFPLNKFTARVDYNFRGPTVGMNFIF
jgi:hypothetical protein